MLRATSLAADLYEAVDVERAARGTLPGFMRPLKPALWILAMLFAALPEASGQAARGSPVPGGHPFGIQERLFEQKVILLPGYGSRAGSDGYIQALVLFAQPRARVMLLLAQTSRQTEFRPDLKSIETVQRFATGTVDEHRMRIMFTNIRYRLRNRWDMDAGRFWWKLDPSFENDLRRIEGFWELHVVEDRWTLGHFGTRVEVGAALPGFLERSLSRKTVPQTIERIRRWIDSDGRYRP